MRTRPLVVGACIAVAVILLTVGLRGPFPGPAPVIVGSTTTTQDTGLLDVLQTAYRAQTGVPIRIVVAGTGAILRLGESGDLDVLFTHDRDRELAFVADGHGLWRRPVMYNWFLLVGPPLPAWSSPHPVERLASDASLFLSLLYEHRSEIRFVSRGDGSGTHSRELALWAQAGISRDDLAAPWYKETGSGQAETLRVAVELGAYALCDEATWNQFVSNGLTGALSVLVRDPDHMKNQYGVIPINDDLHPRAFERGGIAFALWLVGPAGQAVIRDYRVAGQPAFVPNADELSA